MTDKKVRWRWPRNKLQQEDPGNRTLPEDKKQISLWPWNKPQQEDPKSNTTPPKDEDISSDEYESEKEEELPAIADGMSALYRWRARKSR
jgi:hypothetical protein